jgi:hypothetical protein
MWEVSEDQKETKAKFNKEIESIRAFHTGPLKRCSQCGRLVFHPCLACEMERKSRISDPLDADPLDESDLRIELQGKERQRYEHFHVQKVMDEIAKEILIVQ